ncbi:hypothetical protein NQ317_015950 [Molorchus minor]|uniref:Protein LTV1 homolog n=1 Tax=Molorchus minor TaxID=1323400 RepID=A0ABQ9JLD2_9CUCU|nr:hypothetical protein NQ317_015950 [Molorchus minor]
MVQLAINEAINQLNSKQKENYICNLFLGLQLDLDPDIVAAMDDDFDYTDPENQLEDNFVELANGVAADQEFDKNEMSDIDSNFDYDERDEVNSMQGSQQSFEEEETKSRFTSYSMTSSVIRRNDQLTLLDERFEKMYADYDENVVGALDCEEIEGFIPESSDILLQYADEFENMKKRTQMDKSNLAEKIKQQFEDESKNEDDEFVIVPVTEKEKWDCESILSTYSNIYNHPKVIAEPKKGKIVINKKTGVPKNVLFSNKLTTQALNKLNEQNSDHNKSENGSVGGQSLISQLSLLSIRPKHENPEERRERKTHLKEYKRERRIEKKLNTEAFKNEAKRQTKIIINNRNNVQGNKIL